MNDQHLFSHKMLRVFSSPSATLTRLEFPAIFGPFVPVHWLHWYLCTLQIEEIRFPNLCDFFSQPRDALFDGLLHENRLAEPPTGEPLGSVCSLLGLKQYAARPTLVNPAMTTGSLASQKQAGAGARSGWQRGANGRIGVAL